MMGMCDFPGCSCESVNCFLYSSFGPMGNVFVHCSTRIDLCEKHSESFRELKIHEAESKIDKRS